MGVYFDYIAPCFAVLALHWPESMEALHGQTSLINVASIEFEESTMDYGEM
jgi:hypothetical protein